MGEGGEGYLFIHFYRVCVKEIETRLAQDLPWKRLQLPIHFRALSGCADVLPKFPRFTTTEALTVLFSPPTPFHDFMTRNAYDTYADGYDRLIDEPAKCCGHLAE